LSGPPGVARPYAAAGGRRQLWKAAIKWADVFGGGDAGTAGGRLWWLAQGQATALGPASRVLLAAVLLLAWENLANDVF